MHRHLLDNYSQGESPIHRLPAWVKLAFMLAAILAVLTVPVAHHEFFIAITCALILIAMVSRLPPGFLLMRLMLLEPLVLGVAILTLLSPGGWRAFAAIVLRSTLSMSVIVLLANTTPLSEVLMVLRRLRVPALLITTLALMHRYLFVLLDESRRMRRARACRTFNTSRRRTWKTLAGVIGQLFVRSVDRAEPRLCRHAVPGVGNDAYHPRPGSPRSPLPLWRRHPSPPWCELQGGAR